MLNLHADSTEDLFDGIEKHNKKKIEQALQTNGNLEAVNHLGKTALHEAAHTYSPAIGLLVKKGANLEAGDDDNWTPLTYAVLYNKNSIEPLIKAGANINHIDGDNKTPLDHCKDPKIISLLKKFGAKNAFLLLKKKQ